MPNGPGDGYFGCRKCGREKVKFKTKGELRQHQWAEHRETYAKVGKIRQRKLAKQRAGIKHYWAVNGEMKVSELLVELGTQQKFINDVVSLISAMATKHKEQHR